MSVEFFKQFFMHGNEKNYQSSLQNTASSLPEKLQVIESLIYFHKYEEALNELVLIEKNSLQLKQDQKITIIMFKALCYTAPSDKNIAFELTEEAENIITKIRKSTVPLVEEYIIFLFNKGKVQYNFQLLDDAINTFNLCLKESSDNKFYQARSMNRIARINLDQENFELALENIMKALAISTANKYYYEIFLGYEMLGLLNQNKNKSQSLKYFEYCLKIAMNDLKNDILIGKAFMNIGRTKLLQKELDEAQHYWTESLNFYSKANYTTYKPLVLKYLGDLFIRKGNYYEALSYYKESLDLNTNQRVTISGIILFAMGSTYFRIRDFKNALKYYSESLQIKRSIGNKIDLAGALWGIGHVHFIRQNYIKAMKYYSELYEIYKDFGKAEYISEILLIIVTLQNEVGDESECKKYVDLLQNLSLEYSSAHTNLSLSIARALLSKDSRLVNMLDNLNLFKTVLSNLSINQHFSYFSLLNISLIYLQEFILTEQDEVLKDLRNVYLTIRELAIKNNSYPLELFANVLLIQLNYVQNIKDENNSLLIKITSIIELIKVEAIEKEVNRALTKIDRLEKESTKNSKQKSASEIINKLGMEKFVKKIIVEKYWL